MARADTLESTPASRRASPSVVAPPVTRTEDRAVSSRALEAHAVTTAALHDILGNGAVTGSDAAGLAEHAVGSAALGMAGFTGVSGPGSAPLSAMRQILRRSQAEAEGLDVRTAAAHIGVRAGQPLPDAIRARLESAFGHDFSHVRIHADGAAAESAEALNALAFTLGRDIYFSRGAFRPQSPDGLELLAHELTHVVQADEGRLPAASGDGLDVSSPSDPHEREAYAMGEAVARDLGGTLGSLADTSSAGSSLDSGGGGGTLRNASPVRSEAPSHGAAAPGSEALADAHAGPAVTNFGVGGITEDAPALAPTERGSAGGSLQGGVTEGAAVASRWGFGGSGRSANATSPTATASSGTGTSKPGELRLAGHVVKVNAPPSGGGTVETRSMADIAIPGISLKTATVTTGADGTIESGKLHVRLQLGSVFIDSATMSVRKGGVVDDIITGVKVTLPGLGEVPVDVKIGTKNVTA